jgi:hypothetical protein
MIEKSLDTGDLVFFSYDCGQHFTPEETMICYKQKYMQHLQDDDPQNMGICLRTPQKLLVVHSDLLGKIHIEPYSEFLNKPFMNTVKARSFENLPQSAVSGGAKFVEELMA